MPDLPDSRAGPRRARARRASGGGDAGDWRDTARRILLLLLTLGASYLLLLFLWPFLPAIVTSATLAVLAYPAHRRLEASIGHGSAAALIGTAGVFFLVLLPLVGLSVLLVLQLPSRFDWLAREAGGLIAPHGRISAFLEGTAVRLGLDPAVLSEALAQQLRDAGGLLAARTLRLLTGVGGWLLQAGAALFTLYYFLRDGRSLLTILKWLLPLEDAATEQLIRRSREVTFATVYGNVVIAVVQGVIGGLVFWMLGLPAAALWGTVMGLLALLPVIGPPVVWLPAAAVLLLGGSVGKGVLLLLLGGLIISGIDNFLRPYIVSGRTQLHPLVVFFSVLGGIYVLGAVGLIVGPVLFVAALTFIEMGRISLDPPDAPHLPADSLLRCNPAPPEAPRSEGTVPATSAAPT